MDHLSFVPINLQDSGEKLDLSRLSEYFTLAAHPSSMLWRRPRSDTVASAPMVLTHLRHPFVVAEVTVNADFQREWDQGGLVIFSGPSPRFPALSVPPPRRLECSRCTSSHGTSNEQGRWVKAGLELTGNMLQLTSAAASRDSGTDLCLAPLTLSLGEAQLQSSYSDINHTSLRVKLERVGDSLWVWYRIPNPGGFSSTSSYSPTPEICSQAWRKVREVMGFFSGIASKENVWVGCYASRPTAAELATPDGHQVLGREDLVVEFEDFEIL